MKYELIENGVEFECNGLVVQALGEIELGELVVTHSIFRRDRASCEVSSLDMHDLEQIAYFIFSSTCSADSFFCAVAVIEMLMSNGVHPQDALVAFYRVKNRIIWQEILEAIWQQCTSNFGLNV